MVPINVASSDTVDSGAFTGPFSYGGSMFIFSQMYALNYLNVYESTDGGLTYTALAHNLGPFDGHLASGYFDTVQDDSDLVAVWYDGGGSRVQRFSMITRSWGVASGLGPDNALGSTSTHNPMARVLLIGSDLYYFYTEWLIDAQTVNYAVFSAGVWSTGTIIVPAGTSVEFNYISSVFQDSNGLIHVFYRKAIVEGDDAVLYHITLTTGGVIGSEQIVDPTIASFPAGSSFELDGLPYIIYYDSDARTGVWVGDSLTPTTWTWELLNNIDFPAEVIDIGVQVPAGGSPEYGAIGFGFVSDGVAYVIWQSTNGDDFNYTVNRVYMSSNSGSGWSAPTLLYDEALEPGGWYTLNAAKIFGITAAIINDQLFVYADINCGGLGLVAIEDIVPPTPTECETEVDVSITIEAQKKVRYLMYDDGIGEYTSDKPIGTIVGAGSMLPIGVNRVMGMFILPAPMPISKAGLVNLSLTNVEETGVWGSNTEGVVRAHVVLVFAVPKIREGAEITNKGN